MNTKNVFAFVLATSLVFPAFSMAIETTTPTVSPKPRREIRELKKETREEIKEIRKETRETLKGTETQTKLERNRSRLLTNQNGMYKSFTVRASALEKYQAMINERITKKLVKFPGNTVLLNAQSALAGSELKSLWDNYSKDLAAYSVTIATINTSDPVIVKAELKAEAKKVNDGLKAVRKFLVDQLRLVVKAK